MMEERIKEIIDFLRDKANEANALHEKYTTEYEIWCRTGKGKKPIPPIALPIAAQYMKNAAKSLEMALSDDDTILRQAGLDPDEVGAQMKQAAEEALARVKPQSGEKGQRDG